MNKYELSQIKRDNFTVVSCDRQAHGPFCAVLVDACILNPNIQKKIGMALSVALPLSGLEPETYSSYSAFGLRDILAYSQSSPSLSVSSESSGIGSLGSIKSESINGISLPASPQNTDKCVLPKLSPEIGVSYQGRNLLDLNCNVKTNWSFRYAHLPTNNTSMFFNNRSQYHRLSDYPQPEYGAEICPRCHFNFTIA